MIIIVLFASLMSCSTISSLIVPVKEGDWRSETWEGLRTVIREDRKGLFKDKGLFGELDLTIKEKIDMAPVFAENIKGRPSDELYLLSPRNTKIRGGRWDGTFRWNWAVGGSNYVFHLYKDGVKIVESPRSGKRTINLSDSVKFVPGALYSWNITCCVAICNLSLSSNAFARPEFSIMTPEEESVVEGESEILNRKLTSRGIEGSPEGTALNALLLERHKLYLEEERLLLKGIEKHPDSPLLQLVLSSVYDLTGCPAKAREAYEQARELADRTGSNGQ